ncbi:CNGA2.2 family protein [Megaselia abdita]
MWTYMMAAARGDRANSMLSNKRRTETESPLYSYSQRQFYGRSNPRPGFCPYPSSYSNQMYHHNSSTVAHTPNIFQNQSSVDDEDTSLYSPLPIARPEGNDNDGVNVTGTATKHHTSNSINTNEDKTNAANTKANHIKQGSSMNLNSCRTDRKSIITLRQNQHETDEDYDEDDEEGDEVGYLENGIKKHAVDQTKTEKPSALRRTLNALRQRITRRSRAKPPDWFLDKFSNASNVEKLDKKEGEEEGSNSLCTRLSVDTSLPSHYRWLAVVSLAVLYNIIFVVGRAVFWEINRRAAPVWYLLDYLCDFIYLIDTLVHMHEGYLDQGLLVRDAFKLRKNYFKQKGWLTDLLSMFPTDLAYIWWPPSTCSSTYLPCPVIVRLNRLLRLPRMWEWFDRTETATGYPNAFRICKVVLAILVLIHWNACMYFAISYILGFGTDNWVYNLNGDRKPYNVNTSTVFTGPP